MNGLSHPTNSSENAASENPGRTDSGFDRKLKQVEAENTDVSTETVNEDFTCEWETDDLFCPDLPTEPLKDDPLILVTGASGYIGGRLVPELIERGYRVRAMVRAGRFSYAVRWPGVEVFKADALDFERLKKALEGVDIAYYLIHSLMMGPSKFEEADIRAAANFCRAAEHCNLKRIIYLGGLGDEFTTLSHHLKSRMQVAVELRRCKTPVTTLRAAVIIGSGSASYEIIHNLVNKVPLILYPPWVNNKCQPIAIRDVVKYLVGVMETPDSTGKSYDIGGPDILSYLDMMKIFARLLRKKILFIRFPGLKIGFYSYFTSLFTPVPGPMVRCLMDGLKNDVICENNNIRDVVPFKPINYEEAILRALDREERDRVYTRWTAAYPPAHTLAIKLYEIEGGPRYTTQYSLLTDKKAEDLFKSICCIGGKEGWFNNNWMWRLRGLVDKIMLGVGSSRGRRSKTVLRVNDVIDFWRIESIIQNKQLRLRAEMKLPGKAWLEFTIEEEKSKRRLTITPYFHTNSLFGVLYWYIFLPFHGFIFNDLIKQIEKRS